MQIIDAHHHLWDVEKNAAHYPWYTEVHGDRGWGDTSAIMQNYLPSHLRADAEAGGFTVIKSVHVQANYDFANPVGETRWLDEIASDDQGNGLPHAIVGYADLSSDHVQECLEQHAQFERFRGVRQVLNRHPDEKLNRAPEDYLLNPKWHSGLGLLAGMNLSFDAQIYQHQAVDLRQVAETNPDLKIVLDHALMPAERGDDEIAAWRTAVADLATLPNIWMKISGFGMVDNQWTVDSIRPFVLHGIDCFGPHRIMFGSNFPVDKLMADYGRIWSAFDTLTRSFSYDERQAMFVGTAEQFYRI